MVEMIVVSALYSILLLAIAEGISSFYRFNAYTIAQAHQVATARRGLEALIRDIREMTYADDGSYPLVVRGEHKIGFYSDIDRDNSVEYVEYELTNSILYKRIYDAAGMPPTYDATPESTQTLSEYVQNVVQATSTFSYYAENGSTVASTSPVTDIRYVGVKLIVNIDPIRDPGEFMLRGAATLRNLKENF